MKKRFSVVDITMIAVFAALCYISLVVLFVPVGPMFVHVGNLILCTAALLLGGVQGGLAGSIGMGLFDLLGGYAASAPKTFVLKFLIGITVGLVFSALKKREKFPTVQLRVAGAVIAAVGLGIGAYSFIRYGFLSSKTAILAPIFLAVGIILVIFSLFSKRLQPNIAAAFVAVACGMFVNIVGETAYKFVERLLLGDVFQAAASYALLAQASTLINAALAIVGGVALYAALAKPVSKILQR